MPDHPHTYEEIREIVVDLLLKGAAKQWRELVNAVSYVFAERRNLGDQPEVFSSSLHPDDAELVRDVFWDLFRQGFVTLGLNDSNEAWPWFRLSHFGEQALKTQSPFRFHDTGSFMRMVTREVPDISPQARIYLEEAVAAFYAGCLLASSVMLGVAAEAEFLRLADVAAANPVHGSKFAAVAKHHMIRRKITAFQERLLPLTGSLPHDATEDLDTNFNAIQSVLRIARNDAGHPTGAVPQRENVYVYLQLFVPFARQLMRLRTVLA